MRSIQNRRRKKGIKLSVVVTDIVGGDFFSFPTGKLLKKIKVSDSFKWLWDWVNKLNNLTKKKCCIKHGEWSHL